MQSWWKSLRLLAGGLVTLGSILSSANAQFPPGGGGMPPGMMPPGMGMPGGGPAPGMFTGMPGGGGPPPGAFGPSPNGGGMPADFPNPAVPSQEPASPFSMKDEGMPNAFSSLNDPRAQNPMRFQWDVGYALMWYRAGHYPTLATTGSATDPFPGALGQPGTSVLDNGTRLPEASSAFRTNLTYWLIDPQVFCIDANFFIMEQRSLLRSFNSTANGTPLLARPFFSGVEDADLRAFPNAFSGTLADSIRTRMMGSEANLKWFSASLSEGPNFSLFGGIRWFRLDERYLSNDTSTDLGSTGTSRTFSDNFTTYNQFFGGQFGGEWNYRWGRANFGLTGKVAVGPNYETIKISGLNTQTDQTTGVTTTDATQGLYAQASNIGNYRKTTITVIPEVAFKMSIDLCDHVRFNLGYSIFWMNNTVRPGDQMDRNITVQPFGSGGGVFTPALPGPPSFRQSVFNAQMLNFGLEFLF